LRRNELEVELKNNWPLQGIEVGNLSNFGEKTYNLDDEIHSFRLLAC
jgi:hypothetical protein